MSAGTRSPRRWPGRVGRLGFMAALAVPGFFAPGAGRAAPLELEPYLEEVEERNPLIASARLRAEAQMHRVEPAGSWEDPFVAVGPDGIPVEGGGGVGMIRYQVAQALPLPGRLGARAETATARADSAAADAETVARSVRVVATQTYYRALHNQRAVALNAELRGLVGEAVDSGGARYRTGAPNHHEWLLARAELGVLETEEVRLVAAGRTLRASLNELRGRPAQTPVELPSALPPPAPAVEAAASSELDSLTARVRAAESERRSALLAYLPDLLVQGMAEQPRDRGMEEPMWGAMIGFSLPVFWFRKQEELLIAADSERKAAVAERESLERRLDTEIVEAREALETARAVADLYERSVLPATDLAFESARTGYAVGRVSLADLVAVGRARTVQALEHFAARIDVELARVRLAELLSAPPVLQLAPATPTLFGAGMAAGAGMGGGMRGPSAIRLGEGVGVGTGRGGGDDAAGGGMGRMGGM